MEEKINTLLCDLKKFIDSPFVILNEEGNIIFAGENWISSHSVKLKEDQSFPYKNIISNEDDKDKFYQSFQSVLKEGKDITLKIELFSSVEEVKSPKNIVLKRISLLDSKNLIFVKEKEMAIAKESDKIQMAIYKIASESIVAESLFQLSSSIHKIISELIDAKNFYIALYNKEENLLEFPYFVDEIDSPPPPEPLGKNLTSYVIRTGKPLLVDPQTFEELVSRGEVVTEGAPSIDWLGVPLMSNSTPIGVIAVQSYSKTKRYEKKDVDLLNFVSGQIAIAIERRRTLEELKLSEERLRILAESTSAGILIFQDEKIKYLNKSGLKLVGYSEEEIYQMKFWELLREDYREPIKKRAEARLKGNENIPNVYEVVVVTKSGKELWVQLTVSLMNYQGKQATLVTAFDITERKNAEEHLKESEERFRILAETTTAAIFMFKGQWIVYANNAAEALTGYTNKELLSMQLWDLIHPDDFVQCHNEFIKEIKKENKFHFDKIRIVTRSGEEKCISLKGGTAQLEGETVTIATGFDITQIVQSQENLEYLAHHDYLTGLENRWAFHENLLTAMEASDEKNKILSLLFIDIDRFKELNDTEGHIMGDKILRAAASRLASIMDERSKVSRIGSDEFTVLIKDSSPREAEKVAQRIIEAFDEPFIFSGKEFHLSLSIGICLYPTDGTDLETLLKNSDMAMFGAKSQGGGTYQFYRLEMSEEAKERIELRNRLFGAIERNELSLHFQPIYEGRDNLVAFEALLRWYDPKFGNIPPDKFIPIAEESGLIVSLGEWVLNVACTYIENLHREGFKKLRVAVNLSARQFHRRDLLDVLERVINRVGLDPSSLELEITERTAVMDLDSTTAMMHALSRKGIRLAIDDFGAGYSSMTYLKRFPINCLKIDMSFIKDIEKDEKDKAIVKAIITMAHGLGLDVIAEGVETEEQFAILTEIGCDHFQGHYFGKAVPLNSIDLSKADHHSN